MKHHHSWHQLNTIAGKIHIHTGIKYPIPMARDVKLIRCHGNKTHEIGKALKLKCVSLCPLRHDSHLFPPPLHLISLDPLITKMLSCW